MEKNNDPGTIGDGYFKWQSALPWLVTPLTLIGNT